MIYKLETIINFGKHKDETIKAVCDDNPTYIDWCLDNLEWFDLDDEAKDYFEDKMEEYHDYNYEHESWHDGWPGNFGDN